MGACDIETLVYLRNQYPHTSVTKDVCSDFQGCYEFLEFATTAYVIPFALHLLQISKEDDIPANFITSKKKVKHKLLHITKYS